MNTDMVLKIFGVALLLFGLVVAAVGFNLSGGEQILNIGRLNLKVLLVTAGGALFISGAVLWGAAEIVAALQARTQTKE